jgi:adenylosuccinate lyase
MIDRYTRDIMKGIWGDERKYGLWLEIEIAICEVLERLGIIPTHALEHIKTNARFDIEKIREIEKEVRHDVVAFLTSVSSYIVWGAEYLHFGVTSADVTDTCLALQLKMSGELILCYLLRLQYVLGESAKTYKNTLMVGRTHGIHAEAITFGLKLLSFYEETCRNVDRMRHAIYNISVGQVSGSVGTYAHLSMEVEEYVCKKFGLRPETISTQIIPRDRHAEYMTVLAVIASSLERFATEIRNLQRTEIDEVEEPFEEGQKGSSSMPHKKNPEISERIVGLARVIRGNVLTALCNVPLWHERDLTNSASERIILPDTVCLVDYILNRMCFVFENLKVKSSNMLRNLESKKGLVFSQKIMLDLIRKGGLSKKDAYNLVQKAAMKTQDCGGDFLLEIMESFPEQGFDDVPRYYHSLTTFEDLLKSVDNIFDRVFKQNQ